MISTGDDKIEKLISLNYIKANNKKASLDGVLLMS